MDKIVEQIRWYEKNSERKEDDIIRLNLKLINDLYEELAFEDQIFVDKIISVFTEIIKIQRDVMDDLKIGSETYTDFAPNKLSFITMETKDQTSRYQTDELVLADFYNYFKKPDQPPYQEVTSIKFGSEEERRKVVNLTLLDYCFRIKTYSRKYLCEIFENARQYKDPVVFTYNNLEMILAKFQIIEGKGQKQRLNIRSALRKFNEFKQATQEK